MSESFALTLTLREGYQFTVDFAEEGVPQLLVDESRPLGEGAGPNPTRLLAAAVGNCLGASLLFCLRKARIPASELEVRVEGTMERNERGRLRIAGLRVTLAPTVSEADVKRIGRCTEVFEDYCIVTESVRRGIDVAVEVQPTAVVASG
jgi:uncharacterized OsmC-like protein